MRTPASLLHSSTTTTSSSSSSSPPPLREPAISIDSDMVVILASLLCALICVAGLALVARCACRRSRTSSSSPFSSSPPPPPRGLKKKAIESLPTVSFADGAAAAAAGTECAICLAEFVVGEELRVLPRCGHGFHVACIDTWLGAQATCPSCRTGIAAPAPAASTAAGAAGRCRRCGASCDDVASGGGGDERFMP